MRLGRRVQNGGQLAHKRDDTDRKPGEVPLTALREAQQPGPLQDHHEAGEQEDVQPEQDEERHEATASRLAAACVAPGRYSIGMWRLGYWCGSRIRLATKTPVAIRSSHDDVGHPKCTVTSRPSSSSWSSARIALMLRDTLPNWIGKR